MLEQPVHECEGLMRLDPPAYFFQRSAYDTNAGREFQMTMVAIPTTHGHVAIHVDYCPWCGACVTDHVTFVVNSTKSATQQSDDYFSYRKRFVRQGEVGTPMAEGEWEKLLAEYNETEMLLPYAKDGVRESLFERKQFLRNRLALGVMTRTVPPVIEGETAEAYIERVKALWDDAMPDQEFE